MALIDSKQLNPRLSGSFTLSGSLDVNKGELSVSEYIKHVDDTNTYLRFTDDRLRVNVGGISYIDLNDAGSAPHDITFNDGSNNVDFIIKGDSDNPLFKTDASTNRIGTHGKGSPEVDFHIGGAELRVDGNISGSSTGTGSFGRVEASGKVRGSRFEIDGATDYIDTSLGNLFIVTTGDIAAQPGTGKALKVTGGIEATSHITASGDVYVSGNVSGSSTSTGSFGALKVVGKIQGDTTFTDTLTMEGHLYIPDSIVHASDTNTKIRFPEADTIAFNTSGTERLRIDASGHVTASGELTIGANQKLYLNKSEDTYIQSMTGDIARVVAGGSQMLILDYDTGNRAVFGNGTKVYIGSNNNALPDKELVVDGDIMATGDLIAQRYIVSSSVTHLTQSFSSGSTLFGDDSSDNHRFTGSLLVTGSLNVESGRIFEQGSSVIDHATAMAIVFGG